jgi:hypothetical protein
MWDQSKVAMLSSKASFVEHLKRYAYFGKNEKVEIFLPATATIEERQSSAQVQQEEPDFWCFC